MRDCSAPSLLELLDAFAEEPAWPHQQHKRHQEIHRRLAPRRVEVDGNSAHDADERRRSDHAPKRTQAPDDHDDKSRSENFGAHRWMYARDRREQNACESGEPDAERRDCGHIRRKRNPERADNVGVLYACAHHAAEGRSVDNEPCRSDRRECYAENEEAVARIDEVAYQDLATQFRRYRKRKRRGAEHNAKPLLDDHRQSERQQQAQDRIGAIAAPKQEQFNHDAQATDQDRRSDKRSEETYTIGQDHSEVGADGIESAVREIDDAAKRKNQREAKRDQQVIRADQEPIQNLLEDENILHAKDPALKDSDQVRVP